MDRITIDMEVCHGKPCIKGTRIMVSIVLGLLEEGLTFKEIIREYPMLSKKDVISSIHYAKTVIENEEIELTGTVRK